MSHPARPTTVRYRVMGLMCVLAFLTYYDRFSIVRAQEGMKRDLGLTDADLGWLVGTFFLAYSIFEIPGGWLGDRYGARKTLTRIVLAWSLFTALTGSVSGFAWLLAVRFLFGAGEAGAFPNIARVQSAWLPLRSRAAASGTIWLFARWGGAMAPFIFGSITRMVESAQRSTAGAPGLDWLSGVSSWRISFWISGLLGLAWIAAFLPLFGDNPAEHRGVNSGELELIRAGGGRTPARHEHIPGMWRMLLRSPSVLAISALYFFASTGFSFYASWLQRYMEDVHHLSYTRSEWLAALPLLLGGAACFLGGWLSDWVVRRTGRRRLGRAIFPVGGYLIAAAATFAIRYVHTPEQATICMCIAAFSFDLGQGANWASIVDIGGRYAGTAAGFLNMVGNSAGAIAPRLGALAFTTLGWNSLFALYALAYVLAASMWLLIDPTRRFYEGRLGEEAAPASN